ncbi:hypothetical protein Clacol_008340 [Clathrus columnatus]|uniref:Uncharacterized protein n=1 Tax=Clathrus columnatus TaxID=1419009 RepID=A0AAV5AN25_9AGAM|nr:hypothetical protein Clacol_008340 [Clathrus columnatus]
MSIPESERPIFEFGNEECQMDALNWVIIIFTIITTSVTWWLLQSPTLFKKGFRYFMHDIAWECLRLHSPGWVAGSALHKQDRKYWVMAYYTGINKEPTWFDTTKNVVIDFLVIISTISSVYKLCKAELSSQSLSHLGGLNGALPAYPSLPAAVYGLWISLAARTQLRVWIVVTIGFVIMSAVIAGIATSIALTDQSGDNIWIAPTIFAIYMAFPFFLLHHKLLLVCMLLSILTRLGPLIGGALTTPPYPPFCVVRGWGLAGPVLGLGIIGFLLALNGIFLRPRAEEDIVGESIGTSSFRAKTREDWDSRFISKVKRTRYW